MGEYTADGPIHDQVLDWTDLRVYGLDAPGRNHGILIGTRCWSPPDP